MLYPLILSGDSELILDRYRNKLLTAKTALDRQGLWSKMIHDFRISCYLWHFDSSADLLGYRVYWLVPKHTKYARWYEVASGVVSDVVSDNQFEAQGNNGKTVNVRLKSVLAFEKGK